MQEDVTACSAGLPERVVPQDTGWAVCVSMMYQLFQNSQLSHFVSHDVMGFWASAILMQICLGLVPSGCTPLAQTHALLPQVTHSPTQHERAPLLM